MSQLLQLKEWLTLDDVSRHLSNVFAEEVSKADVLRFALDGRLMISVRILNGATAKCGPLISAEAAEYISFPSDLKSAMAASSEGEYQGTYLQVPKGVSLSSGEVIALADDVCSLRGIYDLPMIGGEQLHVERMYQELTHGPDVTLVSMNGAFVVAGDGSYCQLQESFDDNEHQPGSRAAGAMLETVIDRQDVDDETAAKMRADHKDQRKAFLAEPLRHLKSRGYYPTADLPDDAVLVVRVDALMDFIDAVAGPRSPSKKVATDLGTRERDTLLKLVIGMAIGGYGHVPMAAKSKATAEIASDLEAAGVAVDVDTVRKWLKVAATETLPGPASSG